jgi:hypothetical protein
MPPNNRRRRRSQASKGDNSHSDSEQETERKKKVRWEHDSNMMDEEGDCSDSDEDSKGLEKVSIIHFLVFAH